jgi:hypothetical protein
MNQHAQSGDGSIIVQAGRDAFLGIKKSPPNIRLVRMEIEENSDDFCTAQNINIILKNNGDTTAFILSGKLVSDASEQINICSHIGMRFSLSVADWTYDVDISGDEPSFVGRHSISPNEVINFDIKVGRETGGYEPTIYRSFLKLEFDEGEPLITDHFFLKISGPTIWQGGYQARGPTPEQWGRCQADNIKRLDRIGYDFRPVIDKESRKYIDAVCPGLFDKV